MNRTIRTTIVLNEKEQADLEELAGLLGMGKSTALRYAVRLALREERAHQ